MFTNTLEVDPKWTKKVLDEEQVNKYGKHQDRKV